MEKDCCYRRGHALKDVPLEYERSFENGTFNELSKEDRKLLILRFEHPRMSIPEVGEFLGNSRSTISVMENRILQYLSAESGEKRSLEGGDFIIE